MLIAYCCIIARGTAPLLSEDRVTPGGSRRAPRSPPEFWGSSFSGAIADVEVHPETGKVSILRFTSVQGVGKAIHPSYVEGQMQGGSVQGIGWALHEETVNAGRGA